MPVTPPPDDLARRVRAVLLAGEPRSAALNLVNVEAWLADAAGGLDRIQPDDAGPRRG